MHPIHYAVLAAVLVLSGTTFASASTCPKLSVIKDTKLSFAEKSSKGYSVYQLSAYKTNQNWSFVLNPINAESEFQALQIGNKILSKMTKPGVIYEGNNYCSYDTDTPMVNAKAFHYS